MCKKLSFLFLALAMLTCGWCQTLEAAPIILEEIQVRWASPEPEDINLRVTVANPNPLSVEEPIWLRLYVRGNAGEAWRPLKSWSDIDRLPAYFRESRDYLPRPHENLDRALSSGHFQLRAVAELTGGRQAEQVTQYDVEPGKILSSGDDGRDPLRVLKVTLQDTTPYYLSRPETAASLGEVRVSTVVRNVSQTPVTHVTIRLRVETADGHLVEEFSDRLARLEPAEEHEFSPDPLHNYSLAQLRARVLLEFDH